MWQWALLTLPVVTFAQLCQGSATEKADLFFEIVDHPGNPDMVEIIKVRRHMHGIGIIAGTATAWRR